tara:strand:- start:2102 stop:2287 length:186 start_codon:yes stop_codon:yes gene_type:complete
MITEDDIEKALLYAFKKVFPENFGEEKDVQEKDQWTPWTTKFNGHYYKEDENVTTERNNRQ